MSMKTRPSRLTVTAMFTDEPGENEHLEVTFEVEYVWAGQRSWPVFEFAQVTFNGAIPWPEGSWAVKVRF